MSCITLLLRRSSAASRMVRNMTVKIAFPFSRWRTTAAQWKIWAFP